MVMSTLHRLTLKQNTTRKASLKRKRKIAALNDQLRSELVEGI